MHSRLLLVTVLALPAFAAPISSVSASATGAPSCSHTNYCEAYGSLAAANAAVTGRLDGSGSLVSMRLYVYVAPPQYIPWPVFSGHADASASYSFQLVTGAQGTGRVEADVSVLGFDRNFVLQLGDKGFDASQYSSFSAGVLLEQPITISFYGHLGLGGGSHDHGTRTSWASLDAVRVFDSDGNLLQARLLEDVPEPDSLLLVLSGAALIAMRRAHRRRGRR